MLVVIAYDVKDERRRKRLAKELISWGFRVQKSVFEAWLSPREIPELARAIQKIIGEGDKVAIYPIGKRWERRRIALGDAELTDPPDLWIF